jgi:hypothetical protein
MNDYPGLAVSRERANINHHTIQYADFSTVQYFQQEDSEEDEEDDLEEPSKYNHPQSTENLA